MDAAQITLNPQDVGEEFLRSLQHTLLVVSLDAEIPEATICTRTGVGWNDCFTPTRDVVERGGIDIDAYVDETGRLEVYLMDAQATLSEPGKRLGTVQIPLAEFKTVETVAIRLEMSSSEAVSNRTDSAVSVLAMEDVTHVDPQQDETWSPLLAAPQGVQEPARTSP